MFEGAVELLDELDRAGYYLGVATGKSRMGLDRVLAKNGLATPLPCHALRRRGLSEAASRHAAAR